MSKTSEFVMEFSVDRLEMISLASDMSCSVSTEETTDKKPVETTTGDSGCVCSVNQGDMDACPTKSMDPKEKPAKGRRMKGVCGVFRRGWKAVKHHLLCLDPNRVVKITPQSDQDDSELKSVPSPIRNTPTAYTDPELVCLPGQVCEDVPGPSRTEHTRDTDLGDPESSSVADPSSSDPGLEKPAKGRKKKGVCGVFQRGWKAVKHPFLSRDPNRVVNLTPQSDDSEQTQDTDLGDSESPSLTDLFGAYLDLEKPAKGRKKKGVRGFFQRGRLWIKLLYLAYTTPDFPPIQEEPDKSHKSKIAKAGKVIKNTKLPTALRAKAAMDLGLLSYTGGYELAAQAADEYMAIMVELLKTPDLTDQQNIMIVDGLSSMCDSHIDNKNKAQALGLPDTLLEFLSPTSKLCLTAQRRICYLLCVLCLKNISICRHLKESNALQSRLEELASLDWQSWPMNYAKELLRVLGFKQNSTEDALREEEELKG